MRCLIGLLVLAIVWPPAIGAGSRLSTAATALHRSQPVAVAIDEFTEDGAPDLVGAYRRPDGTGLVVVWPGRPSALVACARDDEAPFDPHSSARSIVDCPDLVATGDFDNDGHRDVAAAERGARSVQILSGDGRGDFLAILPHTVDGDIDALASGDVNLADGLSDLVVAVSDGIHSRLLVFEGLDGALHCEPESIPLPAPARRLAIGNFDAGMYGDIAVELDSDSLVVAGRNRMLIAGPRRVPVAPPVVIPGTSPLSTDLPDSPTVAKARLNGDAIDDVVTLSAGAAMPIVRLSAPAATFTVTSALDSGPGTLRDAIDRANASAGADEIDFAIGTGPQTIALESSLPDATEPLTIDGSSQPGFAGRPLVRISGRDDVRQMVRFLAGQSVLRSVLVTNFPSDIKTRTAAVLFLDGNSNRVEGCVFGTDDDGTELPVGLGVAFENSRDNTVGGPLDAARNVFGWCNIGVRVYQGEGHSRIQNNVFGTNITLDAFALCFTGAQIDDSPGNVIGGLLPGEANIAVNCSTYGFDIISLNAAENLVQGNLIGVTPDGRTGTPNYIGVSICGGAQTAAKANLVGGTAAGAANRILGNNFGVVIGTEPFVDATENRILCNVIDECLELGIDLGMDQISMNDAGDGDLGANDQQNAPVLESLEIEGEEAVVTGTLSSRPNESFRIELFSGSSRTAYSNGSGGVMVATTNVETDTAGNGGLALTIPVDELRGDSIVATATDASGDTSEFSVSVALDVLWEPPDTGAGANPPPRNPSVRLQTDIEGRGRKSNTAAAPRALTGYKVYRGSTPGFDISPSNLFQSLPVTTMLPTFVLGRGSFFRITACYDTGESEPTAAIPGGVPPVISTAVRKRQKVVITGTGFTGEVVVLTNGIPFARRAKVKDQETRVVQKNPLVTGDTVLDLARRFSFATVQVRNASGGSDLVRLDAPSGATTRSTGAPARPVRRLPPHRP